MNFNLTQTYFELFSLHPKFEIDKSKLAENYRTLQKTIHPDKFVNASDQEKRISVQKAAFINEAHQILKSPQRRAQYMLELRGVVFNDQSTPPMSQTFLMQQIELREALSEVKSAPKPQEALDEIITELKSGQVDVISKLTTQLNSIDTADLEQSSQLMHELQFLNKLQEESDLIEEDLMLDI